MIHTFQHLWHSISLLKLFVQSVVDTITKHFRNKVFKPSVKWSILFGILPSVFWQILLVSKEGLLKTQVSFVHYAFFFIVLRKHIFSHRSKENSLPEEKIKFSSLNFPRPQYVYTIQWQWPYLQLVLLERFHFSERHWVGGLD